LRRVLREELRKYCQLLRRRCLLHLVHVDGGLQRKSSVIYNHLQSCAEAKNRNCERRTSCVTGAWQGPASHYVLGVRIADYPNLCHMLWPSGSG
jgi:hypothetical protein